MKYRLKNGILAALGLAIGIGAFVADGGYVSKAHAQINLGGNEAQFKRDLRARGYNRIETQKIGLSNSKFHACKGNKRYEVKFDWTGNVDTKVIGNCRQRVDEARAIQILQEQGFDRINIEDQGGNYVAIGCQGNKRFRIKVNYFGDVRGQRKIGRCRSESVSAEDIAANLKQNGYTNIQFTDRTPPTFTANACQGRDKMELILNQRGRVVEENRIGSCRRGLDSKDLITSLEERGLTRVVITDDQLPRYRAEACRGANRVEISMNRRGQIRDEVRIGSCRQAYTAKEIRDVMIKGGVTNVAVLRSKSGFTVRGCSDGRYREFSLNRFGEVLNQKDRGRCSSPAINVLAEKMRSRGMTQLQFFAEGCEKGKKVRIWFDDFANRTHKEVISQCDPEIVGHN